MILERQDIKRDHRNLKAKSLDTRSRIIDSLSRCTSQTGLFGSELSLFLRKVRFNDQKFTANTPVFNIKYNLPEFQNNNLFYFFHDQLDHGPVKYFAESKTTKNNMNTFYLSC